MSHSIHRVTAVELLGGYRMRVSFEDCHRQELDLEPILVGELYGPLRNPTLFAQVQVDPEVHALVWPNGADFDPATLHDWPEHEGAMKALASHWAMASA